MTMQGDGGTPPAPAGYVPPSQPGVAAGSFTGILRGRLVIVSGPTGAIVGVFVYTPGTTPGPGNPPIFWATANTTDPYGNTLTPSALAGTVAGVGSSAVGSQVVFVAGTGPSSDSLVQFPIPSLSLSNVANMASGPVLSTYAALVMSGPAMTGGTQDDWAQIIMYSNDTAGTFARGELRYIDTAGGVHTLLDWGKSDQAIHIPAAGGPFISGETFHNITLAGNFSGTFRVKKLPWNFVAVNANMTWSGTGPTTAVFGSMPDSSYYPVNDVRHPIGFSGIPNAVQAAPRVFIAAAGGGLQLILPQVTAANSSIGFDFTFPTN